MNFRSGKLIKEGWRYRCIEEWLFNNSDIGKIRQERQTDNGYTSKKKAAFTLAEVLITLGVIGVVASITLPTLIKEYNKHAWVNALKQNYSLLNQGFKKMMADDGVEFIEDTEVWRAIHGTPSYCSSSSSSANCKDFYAQINKYFKITSIGSGTDKFGTGNSMMLGYKYKFRNSSYKSIYLDKIIYLSNGAMIWDYSFSKDSNISSDCDAIHTAGGHMCGEAGSFNIDVNGNRGPNEFGKDIFVFDISERGQLAPLGGNDYAVYRASVGSGDIDSYKTKIGINGECLFVGNSAGNGCSGLLIDQLNWKMDY